MDFKNAAYQVLKQKNQPLSYREITKYALEKQLISSSGKTPEATMGAQIYTDIKNLGDKSLFIKVDNGMFGLTEWYKDNNSTNYEPINKNNEPASLTDIIDNLTERQFMSDAPTKFEESIKDAFAFLGFESELIGGKGETDVLLTANIGQESFKVNVDGKTSKSGKITGQQIDWFSLRDHKTKNKVDFIVVVGPDFSGGNLEGRAKENDVSLLRTEDLIKLVEAHAKFPFTLVELKDLFTGKGEIKSQLEDLLSQNLARRNILEQFKVIIEEMLSLQDRLGYFTYDSLAGREKLEDIEIEPKDIEYIINLLKLPFINGVNELADKKYILTIKTKDIANIFYQISLLLKPEKKIEVGKPETIEQETVKIPKNEIKLGTKYFEWGIKGHSVTAYARKDKPYPHHCPLPHFIVIIESIIKGFERHNLVNTEVIFSLLEGENLAANRPFKGKAEEYKIRMVLGILEIEGLIKWTGSKRPIEYKLNVPLEELNSWVEKYIKKEILN